jgi:hypothetical protein
MLNFASKKKISAGGGGGKKSQEAQQQVEEWCKRRVSNLIKEEPTIQIMVMEVVCGDPDCVPIETVIMMSGTEALSIDEAGDKEGESNDKRWMGKVLKPTAQVVEEDIELLFFPAQLTKEGIARAKLDEEEDEKKRAAAAAAAAAAAVAEETAAAATTAISNEGQGEVVEVTVDDGWLGQRTILTRRAPPPRRPGGGGGGEEDQEGPKHRKGRQPTGCPCCDPDMFDLLMTRPPI